jgi:hypothetical protein
LETLAVDLASLAGVDRSAITELALSLPATTGPSALHQFFDSFVLVKR